MNIIRNRRPWVKVFIAYAGFVFDEQPEAGGQIYRSISTTKLLRPETYSLLGPDYQVGQTLEHSFRQSGVDYIPGASVWQVEPDRSVLYLRNGDVRQVGARRLLIATGAMERPVPIPGWTLPGVMGAAAADVLLKSSGTVPSGRVVLAGSGPLLWLTSPFRKYRTDRSGSTCHTDAPGI
jgi:hypothetical protein